MQSVITEENQSAVLTVKKTVAFICPENTTDPIGTGFFMSVSRIDNPNQVVLFLVTNKHVIIEADHDWKGEITGRQPRQTRLRLEDPNGGFFYLALDPNQAILHKNQTVDLAVFIVSVPNRIPVHTVDLSAMHDASATGAMSVEEGRDVFTVGLLGGYAGKEKNYPVCRFGKLAMVSNESWCDAELGDGKEQAWLVDLGMYEGASGSPVWMCPFQIESSIYGQAKMRMGAARLIGVAKAFYDAPNDHTKMLRAVTLVEPIDNLIAMFKDIVNHATFQEQNLVVPAVLRDQELRT